MKDLAFRTKRIGSMLTVMMSRYIIFQQGLGLDMAQVRQALDREPAVRILHSDRNAFLVEGDARKVRALAKHLKGWLTEREVGLSTVNG